VQLTFRRSSKAAFAAAAVVAAALSGAGAGGAQARTLTAGPATFGHAFANAQPGDVVLLRSGDYGTFRGARKRGMVTVRAAHGAAASMRVEFRPASNITLDGVIIRDLEIGDRASKHITVKNSRFDRSQAVIRTSEVVDAHILFKHNRHVGFVKCGGCYEGRVELPGRTDRRSGVTIRDSYFAGGNSDGIQNGGNGVRILHNKFTGIHQIDGSPVHADSIQLYGSTHTVIRGNYFHDVADGIMGADGVKHERIENNVFAGSGSPFAVTLESDEGSIFRHNTMLDAGRCDYNQPCGQLYVGNKSSDPPSRGTVVTDNILSRICVCAGSVRGIAKEGHNLYTRGRGRASTDISGHPRYVGGKQPSKRAGFRLAHGSRGKGSASDGTDRGAHVGRRR
jgi:hypothetical protein